MVGLGTTSGREIGSEVSCAACDWSFHFIYRMMVAIVWRCPTASRQEHCHGYDADSGGDTRVALFWMARSGRAARTYLAHEYSCINLLQYTVPPQG